MGGFEWAAIAALAALGGFALAFATFWITFGRSLGSTDTKADESLAKAKEADEKITLLSTSFGMYREQIARDYIHREAMREVEDRLTSAIDRLGDRFDGFMKALITRDNKTS